MANAQAQHVLLSYNTEVCTSTVTQLHASEHQLLCKGYNACCSGGTCQILGWLMLLACLAVGRLITLMECLPVRSCILEAQCQ